MSTRFLWTVTTALALATSGCGEEKPVPLDDGHGTNLGNGLDPTDTGPLAGETPNNAEDADTPHSADDAGTSGPVLGEPPSDGQDEAVEAPLPQAP